MEPRDVERWVDRYIEAWRSNDPGDIGSLFTEDARYYTAPHREPWTTRRGIVEGWLGRKDEPGTWSFRYHVRALAGDIAFVRGVTDYPGATPSRYSNLWEIRLTPDGEASEFVEWWMEADG